MVLNIKKEEMKIDLIQLKKLREFTKVGIMDCRLALEEAKGDFSKAKKILLVKSQKIAKAKLNRATASGVIASYVHSHGQIAALAALACETDFVAKNKDFVKLAHELAMQVAAMNPKTIEDLLQQEYIRDNSLTIADLIKQAIGTIKENIQVKQITRMEV